VKEREQKMKMIKLFIFAVIASGLLVNDAFAHGTEEEHQKEILAGMAANALIGAVVIFALIAVIYIMTKRKVDTLDVKKKEGRDIRNRLFARLKSLKWGGGISLAAVLLFGSIALWNQSGSSAPEVTFKHIHGLGITGDGEQVYVPAHDGLRVFSDGKWRVPEGSKHDYMGFSMVDDGFYSSGHPAPGSDMVNPFGIVKSTDGGKSIDTLALKGETDFHMMAVGYRTHAIYAFNPASNSKMDTAGLYYSTDDAKSWKKSKMDGLNDEPTALAVHQTKENIVAVGMRDGLYLSKDYGDTFEVVLSGLGVTALSFGNEGQLWVGGVQNGAVLVQLNIESKQSEEINIPGMKEDAVSYIAQNPQSSKEIFIATYKMDFYKTTDNGKEWTQIADDGEGISIKK
jgi:hypothetical protein